MGLKDLGTLSKLTITGKNALDVTETFTVMFNPESYSEKFVIKYREKKTARNGVEEYMYVKSLPQDFSLKIIIDTTGVTDFSVPYISLFNKGENVYTKVNQFLRLAWFPGGTEKKPNPLEIKWGEFQYNCYLKDVNINYTLFDREGKPIRAEMDATFIGNTKENEKYYTKRFKASASEKNINTIKSNTGSSTTPTNTGTNQSSSSVQNGIVIKVT